MIAYLFDTDVVSALRRPHLLRPNVAEILSNINLSEAMISVITIEEIERGVLGKERSDAEQGRVLRDWLENVVLKGFGGSVKPVDDKVARVAASLHVPDPRPYADALIAATAIVHDATLVTGNAKDHPDAPGLTVLAIDLSRE